MLKRGKALFASKCAVSTQNMVVRETAEIMPLVEDTGMLGSGVLFGITFNITPGVQVFFFLLKSRLGGSGVFFIEITPGGSRCFFVFFCLNQAWGVPVCVFFEITPGRCFLSKSRLGGFSLLFL